MEELNRTIDHTILNPDARSSDVQKIIDEALRYNFYSVCVNSSFVKMVSKALEGSNVHTCSVIGFPLGAMKTEAKVFEAKEAIKDGADEIDMVLHIGKLIDGDEEYIVQDIKAVKDAIGGKVLKVIIETSLLEQEEKISACRLALEAGADFVKTSTGFSTGGATLEDVLLMKEIVGDRMKIKASGGIYSYDDALAFIRAGADRIGASRSVDIVRNV